MRQKQMHRHTATFFRVRTFGMQFYFAGSYTPLRLGSCQGTAAVVKALLEGGADATMIDYSGQGMVCECVYGVSLIISGMSWRQDHAPHGRQVFSRMART